MWQRYSGYSGIKVGHRANGGGFDRTVDLVPMIGHFPRVFLGHSVPKPLRKVKLSAAGVPSVGSQVAVPSPDMDVDRAAPSNKRMGLTGEMAVWSCHGTVLGHQDLSGPRWTLTCWLLRGVLFR